MSKGGRVIFVTSVTRALITDVRLCNEMCNFLSCRKGAVMHFTEEGNESMGIKTKQKAKKAQTAAQQGTVCFYMLITFFSLVVKG